MDNKTMLTLALALRRIAYKVDDETLEKIQPEFEEIERLLLQLDENMRGAYNKAIYDLFNSPLNNTTQTCTMTEYYEKPSNYDFDEGWNECYRNFKEIADRLTKDNNDDDIEQFRRQHPNGHP